MRFSLSYSTQSIRNKILIVVIVTFVPYALLMGLISYSAIQNSLEVKIINELRNTTETTKNMVVASVWLSIKSYLHSVVESNRKTLYHLYTKQLNGELTEMEAQREAAEMLLSQKIGQTGYIYCVNSQGIATVHPSQQLRGGDFSSVDIVVKQIEQKEGYLEYEGENPADNTARAKVSYMTYFEPWDWIISATAYRDEFKMLLNIGDFRQNLELLDFRKKADSFVMNLQGNLIIHSSLQGKNAFDNTFPIEPDFIKTMIREKRGKQIVSLPNPSEGELRKKMIIYDYIPEIAWIVASSAFLDTQDSPLKILRNRTIIAGLFCLLIGLLVGVYAGASISNPIKKLLLKLSTRTPGQNFQERNEVEQLYVHLNYFVTDLEKAARRRIQGEQDLRSSQERYRAVMERYRAVMESAPDPIMILGLKGEVNYLNQAFIRVFGWQIEDFSDNSAHSFNPPAERKRLLNILRRLLGGEVLANEESVLTTKDGKQLMVNTSGGPFWDDTGIISGCVIILRDITQLKLLERKVIDTDERDRIRVGQELHDDLVPHLIGLDVMFKLLKRRINDDIEAANKQAETVQEVITDAIKKTRSLSRGLSPVHLVEGGMEMGVRQLGEMVSTIFGISCNVEWEGTVSLETTTAVHVYRIIQEALNNAVKHANADLLIVKCHVEGDVAIFEVSDNGLGLKEPWDKNGMGLKIMAFRAKMIVGSLEVIQENDNGTVVRLSVKQGN